MVLALAHDPKVWQKPVPAGGGQRGQRVPRRQSPTSPLSWEARGLLSHPDLLERRAPVVESIPLPICSLIFPGAFGLAWSRERSPQRWQWAPGGALTLAPSWQWGARSGSGGTWEGLAALRPQPPRAHSTGWRLPFYSPPPRVCWLVDSCSRLMGKNLKNHIAKIVYKKNSELL